MTIPQSGSPAQTRPPGGGTPEAALRDSAERGLSKRLETYRAGEVPVDAESYHRRLRDELRLVESAQLAERFLILRDLAVRLRRRAIARGPGCGTAASSLLLWALDLTDVDPVRFDLLFERHLSGALSTALAVDLTQGRHREGLSVLQDIFGPMRVAEIEGDLAARGGDHIEVVVGRETLPAALLARATAIDLALLRFSFAELDAVWLGDAEGCDPTFWRLDDARVFRLLGAGLVPVKSIFQADEASLRRCLIEAKPTSFEDLVALVALDRPGDPFPELRSKFLQRRGSGPRNSPHPVFEETTAGTNGLFLYQEQVIQALSRLTGFSLGRAEMVRRNLFRHHLQHLVEEERQAFLRATCVAGLEGATARRLFEDLCAAARLACNRSHLVAYSLLIYWTACHVSSDRGP